MKSQTHQVKVRSADLRAYLMVDAGMHHVIEWPRSRCCLSYGVEMTVSPPIIVYCDGLAFIAVHVLTCTAETSLIGMYISLAEANLREQLPDAPEEPLPSVVVPIRRRA